MPISTPASISSISRNSTSSKVFAALEAVYHQPEAPVANPEAYIETIAKAEQYGIDLDGRLPETPMVESEILPTCPWPVRPTPKSSDEGLSVRPSPLPKVADSSTMLYQRKLGSMLYATTRPDFAFAVSRLARFNHDPSQEHHRVADRVIQYLYGTRNRAICYGGVVSGTNDMRDDGEMEMRPTPLSVPAMHRSRIHCRSRKFSRLYHDSWRCLEADRLESEYCYMTSSTKAELLAQSQTAKEAIFISKLFKAMTLKLNEPLIIDPDAPIDKGRHCKAT